MARRKTSKSPPPSREEVALFHDAIGTVRRLPAQDAPPRRPPPPPRARLFEADEARVAGELLDGFDPTVMETGAELAYLKAGHSPHLLKRLKRGHYSVADELDLHHMNAVAARLAIAQFLAEAHRHDHACVRIVHGKGWRSGPGGPVLKGLTDHLLRRRKDVLAFASALPTQGGTGAVLVLLDTR
ncbi:MAG TPA: Smr/MutS family protein [Rhodanobacteraceae bacterium]|nr:Smr/MutS family protein [Rhodanobacteraceae bacterium]